jgi:hypothetical protein
MFIDALSVQLGIQKAYKLFREPFWIFNFAYTLQSSFLKGNSP